MTRIQMLCDKCRSTFALSLKPQNDGKIHRVTCPFCKEVFEKTVTSDSALAASIPLAALAIFAGAGFGAIMRSIGMLPNLAGQVGIFGPCLMLSLMYFNKTHQRIGAIAFLVGSTIGVALVG